MQSSARAQRIVFILGSGASQPAGLPLVPAITDRVLTGSQVVCHSGEQFSISSESAIPDRYRVNPDVLGLITHIRDLIRPFYEGYKPSRLPTYEDIGYVTRQVADSIQREYENPALLPFVEELRRWLKHRDVGRVYYSCDEATKYIKGVTAAMLSTPPKRTDHLGCLVAACQRTGTHVTIASLNHDCVVEAALCSAGVQAHDGFIGPDGDVFVFNDAFPDDSAPHLLKLHGSIDWFRYQVDDPGGGGRRSIFVRSPNDDKEHLRDGDGRALGYTADPQPQILVGTFSKILDYANFVFVDLHARLHQALKRADLLVVIGYGGQDKVINSRIIHWMDEDAGRKCCIVDPRPEILLEAGRPAIQSSLRYWQTCGRVRVVPRGVETVAWAEIGAE